MLRGVGLLRKRRPNVEKLGRKRDVDGLIRALGYEDVVRSRDGQVVDLGAPVRRDATDALSEIETHAAFEGLLRALDDPLPAVRVVAVRGLRRRGDPLAVEQLTSAATNWIEPVYEEARAEAVEALAFLRDPTTPRRVAAGLLTRAADLTESDGPVLRKLAHAGGHDALLSTIADLVNRLRDGTATDRTCRLLVWLAPHSVEPLVDALAVVPARRAAIAALGAAHDSRAVEGLCSVLLSEDEPEVRAAAARALGEIRDPAAIEALLLASGDGNYEIRSAATESFDRLGNAGIAMALMSVVRPALEDGNDPQRDEIPAHAPERDSDDEPAEEAPAPVTAEPAATPEPSPAATRPSERSAMTQVAPIIRRWLGRPD